MILSHTRFQTSALLAVVFAVALPASAQWFDIKKKNVPRNPDGTPNMTAPVPKLPDGHVDLNGVWLGDNWQPKGRRPPVPGTQRNQISGKMLPAAQAEFERRVKSNMVDDPKVHCMPNGVPHANTEPYPFEIVQTPDKTLMLYEMYYLRRQVFTDGRKLPDNPTDFTPTWMGYSVGHWEGDEFVVNTEGFNNKVWPIDMGAHPSSDMLKVEERFKRVDFGHMDITVTIDDSKTYEKPWTETLRYTLLPDTDLLEFVCEVNPDPQHMTGK